MDSGLIDLESIASGLFEANPDPMVICDPRGRIVLFNSRAEAMFGYGREDIVGQPLDLLVPLRARGFHAGYCSTYFADPHTRPMGKGRFLTARRRDGTEFPAEISLSPVQSPKGLYVVSVVRDISERLDAERALREAEERFRLAMDEAPIGMSLLALDGEILRVNAALCAIVGYSPEELRHRPFWELVDPPERPQVRTLIEKLLSGELQQYQLEEHYVAKNGSRIPVLIHRAVLRDREGRPSLFVCQLQDIRERKKAEEALRRSEAQFREVIDQAVDAIMIADLDGRYLDVNAAACEMLGYRREELIGRSVVDQIPAEDASRLASTRELLLQSREGHLAEWTLRRRDGTLLPVEVSSKILSDGRWLGFFRDISERKRTERDRERTISRLRTVLEQAPVAIFILEGIQGERLIANHAAEQLVGRPLVPEKGLAQYAEMLFTADERPMSQDQLPSRQAIRGTLPGPMEMRVRRPDGQFIPILVHAAPLRGAGGTVEGAVVVCEDLTPVKQLERLRVEWNSMVAHDLRHPLQAVSLYVHMLRRVAGEQPELQRYIGKIQEALSRIDRMVSDLLDFSRLEAGQLALALEPVDARVVVEESVERASLDAPDRPMKFRCDSPRTWVRADPLRLAQVMDNLLSNAVKYGRPKSPIEVELLGSEDQVAVIVTNHGEGIPPEGIERLFQRFQRVDDARRGAVGGVGLGLYITRALVEGMGGQIAVESTLGATTTFRFTVPAVQPGQELRGAVH